MSSIKNTGMQKECEELKRYLNTHILLCQARPEICRTVSQSSKKGGFKKVFLKEKLFEMGTDIQQELCLISEESHSSKICALGLQ